MTLDIGLEYPGKGVKVLAVYIKKERGWLNYSIPFIKITITYNCSTSIFQKAIFSLIFKNF